MSMNLHMRIEYINKPVLLFLIRYRSTESLENHVSKPIMPQEIKSAISTQKCSKELAEYIWNSPCLKPWLFNPFLLCLLVIGVIVIIDYLDGKEFEDTSIIFMLQHTFTMFVGVSGLLVLNNILIKHKYRLEKEELKNELYNDNIDEVETTSS